MIAVVDSGVANLSSVLFALERIGASPKLTANAKDIQAASHVVLPGVGHANAAMKSLAKRNLLELIPNLSQPVMGICLGMQLLFKHSDEGDCNTLGIIDASVERLDTGDHPCPHMGWNQLNRLKDHPLLKQVCDDDYVYFVHSYAVPVGNYTLASTEYGQCFSAIVQHNNFFGCQFHPERSGRVGQQILANFMDIQ